MSRTYRYRVLEEMLTEKIRKKKYSPHDLLPSYAYLRDEYGYSIATVTRAFDSMEKKGLIYSIHGKGTFVSPPVRSRKILILYPGDGFYRESALFLDGAQKYLFRNNRAYLPVLLPLSLFMEDPQNLTISYPDIRGVIVFRDYPAFRRLKEMLKGQDVSLLFYGSSSNDPSPDSNTCLYDERQIASSAVMHLRERGYGESGGVFFGGEGLGKTRFDAFRREASGKGLRIREDYVYTGPDESGVFRKWLDDRHWDGLPLYVPMGRHLFSLYHQILRFPLFMPGEIGLLGVDRTELADLKKGAPSFLELPTSRDGGSCAEFLINLIEKRIGSVRGTSLVKVVSGGNASVVCPFSGEVNRIARVFTCYFTDISIPFSLYTTICLND